MVSGLVPIVAWRCRWSATAAPHPDHRVASGLWDRRASRVL